MTMLKSFDLKDSARQSFANWISNLSPCETPFTSMVGKESVDQVQYSWQVDQLAKPAVVADAAQEGSLVTFKKPAGTLVKHNYTQILRKVVRVSDTTKKIGLYGRESELALQLEKAGMELKRDLEFMMLNNNEAGMPGTSQVAGKFAGFVPLVAASAAADGDTGAVVHKVVKYANAAPIKFTQVQVFDLTYNLYLAGSRANKIMFHPEHMGVFADWMSNNAAVTPHVHRMFDGMETKFNVHVTTIRDPLGQEFTLIPNRHMPRNRLFFFNEADWTQMLLRAPEKVELAKNGSAEKHMIEMEVGLRHRNPFASGILEFNEADKAIINSIEADPSNLIADDATKSTVRVVVRSADGAKGTAAETVVFTATDADGTAVSFDNAGTVTPAANAEDTEFVATNTIKHNKATRLKVKAKVTGGDGEKPAELVLETFETRDK